MKKFLPILMLVTLVLAMIQGCSRRVAMQIKGSDTMVNLGQAWAEAYMKEHPGTSIAVTGGGSGVGIAALINGDTDIAQASREMTQEEMNLAKKRGLSPQRFVVAQDGLSVIVNPKNPVSKLTIAQLSDIYTGKITNWKQVGGKNAPIVVLSRDKSSGTHVFFLEHVVRKGNPKGTEEYGRSVLMQVSSQAIAEEVAQNENAIGYVGMGYVDRSKHKTIAVAKAAGYPYVEPTVENVLNGSYPIARQLYFYTPNKPAGNVKDFIDFVLSDAGQRIVAKLEFVPIRTVAKEASK